MGTARGAAEAPDQPMFLVEAYDRQSGKRLWQYRTEALGPIPTSHDKANMALSSPVSDGSMVYAWFSNGQLVALNMKGALLWQRHLGKDLGTFDIEWGHSSSPTLFEDTLILLCDNNNASNLLAVDKKTGTERWRVDRGPKRQSYSTPFVVPGSAGPELVVNSSQRVDVYNPRTGELALACRQPAPVSDPVTDLPRRRALHVARLPQRSVHGRANRRQRRRQQLARGLAGGDRRAVHLVARLRRGPGLHDDRHRRHYRR